MKQSTQTQTPAKKHKHYNIPVFIPHLGCPHQCVFCNQRTISGQQSFQKENVAGIIERIRATLPPDSEAEIAFFGGSFTGIDRDLMRWLLDLATSYIHNPCPGQARVTAIRISTRPDYISPDILSLLSRYPVKTVELGLQSMSDRVLTAAKRGHTALQAQEACRAVVNAGFALIGQMMIGLPESTIDEEIKTAERISALGATGARIYPTVVFRDTMLGDMTIAGTYKPLSQEQVVFRSASALRVFEEHAVPVIRIGLCASENLADPTMVLGGANQPAIGEIVRGETYYLRLRDLFAVAGLPCDTVARACIVVGAGKASQAAGQHRRNLSRLCEEFHLSHLSVKEREGAELSVIPLYKNC